MKNKPKVKCMMIKALLVALLFIIGIPLIINWLYMQDEGFQTVWAGADALSFYGAILGAGGTIVLGVVAWKQNDRLLRLEETKYTLEVQPLVILVDWSVKAFYDFFQSDDRGETIWVSSSNEAKSDNGVESQVINLQLVNSTNSFMTVEFLQVKNCISGLPLNWQKTYINKTNHKLRLKAGEEGSLALFLPLQEFEDAISNGALRFSLILENRFGVKYIEEFDADIRIAPPFPMGNVTRLLVQTSNYKVEPYSN